MSLDETAVHIVIYAGMTIHGAPKFKGAPAAAHLWTKSSLVHYRSYNATVCISQDTLPDCDLIKIAIK